MNGRNLIKRGNGSIAVGTLLGISAATVCPCPFCIVSSAALIFNGAREKLSDK